MADIFSADTSIDLIDTAQETQREQLPIELPGRTEFAERRE